MRAKWGKPAIAGQLPTTGLPTRMRAKGGNFGTCRLAAYRVYKLEWGPNGASLQLQVSYLLRGYQLEWELKGATLGPVGWRPTGFISSNEGQMGQACKCRSATYYGASQLRIAELKGHLWDLLGWRPTRVYKLEWELKGASLQLQVSYLGTAAYRVYKLKWGPNGASLQLQVSYLLRGYQLEW